MDYQVMEEEYALDSGMVLIVSDSHSRNENLEKVMERVSPDLMLHLGDSEDYEDWIREAAPCPVVFVKGNCDYGRELPGAAIVRLGRHRAYLTHGHMHGVHYGMEHLAASARENGCDAAMYGHTHVPVITEEEGILIYNPGSISLPRQDDRRPTYLCLDVDPKGEWHPALKYVKDERREARNPKKQFGWFW